MLKNRLGMSEQAIGKIIAVGNLKGGVGKSTVTVNLAAWLSAQGKRVCIVDCDRQATAAHWLIEAGLDIHVVAMPNDQPNHTALWLSQVRALAGQFDLILIDLPASMNHALGSALLLAHLVLIPSSPSFVDIHATERMIDAIKAAGAEREGQPPLALLVPTQVPERLRGSDELQRRFERFGIPIGPGLHFDEAFQEAFQSYQSIGQYSPETPAARDLADVCETVEGILVFAETPPLLAKASGVLAKIGACLPTLDLASNHKEALSWWAKLLKKA